jgi:hypothetical protein
MPNMPSEVVDSDVTLIVLNIDVTSERGLAPAGRRGPIGRGPLVGERWLSGGGEAGGDVNIGGTRGGGPMGSGTDAG